VTIREQVARRLCDGSIKSPTYRAWQFLTERSRNRWMRVADECIRIAEWARRQGYDESRVYFTANGMDFSASLEGGKPLALPPDEWQP
jgi:phosphate uptake regulator